MLWRSRGITSLGEPCCSQVPCRPGLWGAFVWCAHRSWLTPRWVIAITFSLRLFSAAMNQATFQDSWSTKVYSTFSSFSWAWNLFKSMFYYIKIRVGMPPRVVVMTNANYSLSTMPHIKQTSEKKVVVLMQWWWGWRGYDVGDAGRDDYSSEDQTEEFLLVIHGFPFRGCKFQVLLPCQ